MQHDLSTADQSSASADEATGYEPPRADDLGTLAELTQGGVGSSSDGVFENSVGPS